MTEQEEDQMADELSDTIAQLFIGKPLVVQAGVIAQLLGRFLDLHPVQDRQAELDLFVETVKRPRMRH
jgi:hypothetical protein